MRDDAENVARLARVLASGCGQYRQLTELPDGRLACVTRFLYTDAILAGVTERGYQDRWCYAHGYAAEDALEDWMANFATQSEPQGWHRHPPTGRRRREDGTEYFMP
jgi:hypothetical protein